MEDFEMTVFKAGSKYGSDEALRELIKKLEEIDPCEFAMFTLCLIKEKIDEVKDEMEKDWRNDNVKKNTGL